MTDELAVEVVIPEPRVPTEGEIEALAAEMKGKRDAEEADRDRAAATAILLGELNRDRFVAEAQAARVAAGWQVPHVVWPGLPVAPLTNRGVPVALAPHEPWLLRPDGVYRKVRGGAHLVCSPVFPVGIVTGRPPLLTPSPTLPATMVESSDCPVLVAVMRGSKWVKVELPTGIDDTVMFGDNALRALVDVGLRINRDDPVLDTTPATFGERPATSCAQMTAWFLARAFNEIPM
jgi:hypothetical protein